MYISLLFKKILSYIMMSIDNKYNRGKYTLLCREDNNLTYVVSTTRPLYKGHKHRCNNENHIYNNGNHIDYQKCAN